MNTQSMVGRGRRLVNRTLPAASILVLSACATYPPGPSVMVLPGQSTSFEQFQYDDFQCQTYARNALGQDSTAQNASESAINSSVTGAGAELR